ncbi:response regulator [Mesorhizobium loti]|nr:response regulator [Mesorhizobium loti]PLP56580.1 response regulator [Mesorhizobium loti]
MKRCMFVDKSSVIRKVAKRILTSESMLVIEASAGREAIDLCSAEMPDIIVFDVSLQDMQLAEFIGQIRSLGSPVVPQIVALLVELDLGTIMRAKRAGAHGYLLKPFNRIQLLDRFRALQANRDTTRTKTPASTKNPAQAGSFDIRL